MGAMKQGLYKYMAQNLIQDVNSNSKSSMIIRYLHPGERKKIVVLVLI